MNNDITIGFDLGNEKHKVVGLDVCGKIILKCELSNDKETPGAFFNEHAGATVAMETGTHCRWISSLAKRCGCDAMVETPASSAQYGKARRRTTGRMRR